MTLQSGVTIYNRYSIEQLLGQGGFGAVYRAWDKNLQMQVALKESLATTPEAARQFTREATILARLRHPNLPRVTDHFVIPEQGQYLVMDYIEGNDLQSLLHRNQGPLPAADVLRWVAQVCDALLYLHAQNPPIIHRDIKPSNIRITPQGQAVLVDFGIAKQFNPSMSTTVGARAISPGFSPLEQYGMGGTDERSDVYAMGATLYTLLTGQSPIESIQRVSGVELVLPRQINPEVSPEIEELIVKALETQPFNRCSTAQLMEGLRNSIEKIPTARHPQASNAGTTLPAFTPAAVETPEAAEIPAVLAAPSSLPEPARPDSAIPPEDAPSELLTLPPSQPPSQPPARMASQPPSRPPSQPPLAVSPQSPQVSGPGETRAQSVPPAAPPAKRRSLLLWSGIGGCAILALLCVSFAIDLVITNIPNITLMSSTNTPPVVIALPTTAIPIASRPTVTPRVVLPTIIESTNTPAVILGTIRIAVQSPLSGDMAIMGQDIKNGVDLAVRQFSGPLLGMG